MNTIAEYHIETNRINELEELLRKALNSKKEWKCKYWSLAKKHKIKKPPTRTDKALLLIEQLRSTGRPIDLIKTIANQCSLSNSYVEDLWHKK